jgi:hypothetical protein
MPVRAVSHGRTNLPEVVSELIGRDREFEEILTLTASHRIVTLTGAGGIGKTHLGLEIARRLLPNFVDGVWLVELARLSDPHLVPVAVATALGLELAADAATSLSVANALRSTIASMLSTRRLRWPRRGPASLRRRSAVHRAGARGQFVVFA